MSGFSDFQRAWAQRFPDCELPKAWEDDVRANLVKRCQKLASLKDELEKEEFYVQYLEQQLANVERVKKKPTLRSESCDNIPANADRVSLESVQSSLATDEESINQPRDFTEDNAQLPHKQNDKIEDYNSYVTVIEVGGALPSMTITKTETSDLQTSMLSSDNHMLDNNKEHGEKESPPTSLQQKKKPPAPPKKPRKSIPVQAVPPVKKAADIPEPIIESTELETETKSEEPCPIKDIPRENVLVTDLDENIEHNKDVVLELSDQTLLQDVDDTGDETEVNSTVREESISMDSMEQETDSYDCENIYDTVASEDADVIDEKDLNTDLSPRESSGEYVDFAEPSVADNKPLSTEKHHPCVPSRQLSTQKSVDEEESPEYATYMNIDYFLRNKPTLASQGESDEDEAFLAHSFSSDHEVNSCDSSNPDKTLVGNVANDDVFEMDSGMYSSSVDSTSYLAEPATPPPRKKNVNDVESIKNETERITMYKCILNSIVESESVYVECLNMLLQYMKAFKCSIGTTQQLLSLEDFNIIFFRIPELYTLHQGFIIGLRKQISNWDGTQTIGEGFKILASKLGVYGSFLQNYSKAIETVRKCSVDNSMFSGITKSIKLKALQGQATNLEDLLHKPVARVQKNALVLHDLLRYTPENHPDYKTLKTALKMTQCFLNDINISATESMFPITDRAQRHLVKNSFIVELFENHRKLRHLFLFSDVIVCAKYKPSTRQKFTFEVKWFIPLSEVFLPDVTGETECVKENSPFDILSLKSRASNVRDRILKEEKGSQGKERTRVSGRNIDKHRKKLAELEAQLVLASPNLVFRICQKLGKTYTFFLSSEFERAQWIEAIGILQTSAPASVLPISPYELQAWLTSCRKHFGTNLGTFLLRSGKDEDLLVGDLHLIVHRLHGLTRPSDVYLCFEVDSYGHFFNKAKTKVCTNTLEPNFEQDFIIELEGSQTLRILCYENHPNEGPVLRGKGALELSRSWLTDNTQEKSVSLQDLMLTVSLKYEPPELSLRRIPSSKSGGVFGVKIQQVCKKEKSLVPFIIICCLREVERRGMHEIGIYRVSGSASDVQRLKKSFETNVYEAEQLMKEVDIHSVTGLFKMYMRELPEALFTDLLYQKFFHAFSGSNDQEGKKRQLLQLFSELPELNQKIIEYLLDHMIRINQHESTNKMSLHNLATVFGPTLLRPGSRSSSSSSTDLLTAGTVDVMAQAGIFYFFLKRRAAGLPLKPESVK